MKIIFKILFNALVVYGLAWLLPGISVSDYKDAVIVAILLGLVNAIVKPIVQIITFPVTIITLGLWLLVINGAMILLVDHFFSGFYVSGWWSAIIFALLMSIFGTSYDKASDRRDR
ncbi:MAG: phage holin family protein [Saprospiraceae bacterium]|nr:phage holin family protein [Saprospiraceae bacterium]